MQSLDIPLYKSIPIICGPTASGKSALSMDLCRKINGELVSLDSMQIYKGLDIGTAKPSKKEQEEIPHHLIDIIEPSEEYNVSYLQKEAELSIADILKRKKLPVLCGGTGQYVQALSLGIEYIDIKEDPEIRNRLHKEAEENGYEFMYKRLTQIDPRASEKIHPNNKRRVLRAIEIYELTGIPMSIHNDNSLKKGARYPFCVFYLERDREELYSRINDRVDQMIQDGLIHEVETLRMTNKNLSKTALQAIGYKELYAYLDGEIKQEEAIELIKQRSRNYAKRQITWFSHMENCIKITPDQFNFVLEKIQE